MAAGPSLTNNASAAGIRHPGVLGAANGLVDGRLASGGLRPRVRSVPSRPHAPARRGQLLQRPLLLHARAARHRLLLRPHGDGRGRPRRVRRARVHGPVRLRRARRGRREARRMHRRAQRGVVGVLDQQRHGAEALLEQRLGPIRDGGGIGPQHDRLRGALGLFGGSGHDRDRRVGLEVRETGRERRGDAVGQQRPTGCARNEARDELVEAGSGRDEHHTRLGAELPDPERERGDQALRERLTAPRDGGRGENHGIDAAELAVEGDGVLSPGRQVEQGASAAQRAGEPGGLDRGMLHEGVAGFATLDETERARGCSRRFQGRGDDLGGALGQAGMAGVRLHDHGVPGREGRGGVAAGDAPRDAAVTAREGTARGSWGGVCAAHERWPQQRDARQDAPPLPSLFLVVPQFPLDVLLPRPSSYWCALSS